MKTVRVWDLPTRLFHWLLVVAIVAAYITGDQGGNWLIWHGRIGIFIVGLITFRLVWGFVGSTYARFATFVRGPQTIRAYLQGRWQGLGHNPLGALSVLGLLAVVGLQVASGLFSNNDDTGYAGFLAGLISSDLSGQITGLHKKIIDGLLILIGLHLAAIIFYTRFKKEKLVKPMITGNTESAAGEPARGGGWVALIAALLIAFAAMWAASGAWLPAPPPPPPASAAPDW